MTYTLTAKKALELLEKAVAEKGEDFVYDDFMPNPYYPDDSTAPGLCRYANDEGAPSCIVGHAVKYLSDELVEPLIYDELLSQSDSFVPSVAGLGFSSLIMLPLAVDVLGTAQRKQDTGKTWGEALESARQRLLVADEH